MRRLSAFVAACASALAFAAMAKLPPPTDEAKAKAAEAASKASWNDKVAAYKLCLVQDRVVASYRASPAGKGASAAGTAPPCHDPGAYTPLTAEASKPLEASGAHSPPGTATSPPSNKPTAAELQGTKK
jgi:hypothetical protein